MARRLFEEFEPISSKQWKQQIQFELKGADFNETLVWNSPEGIGVRPFYHYDESQSMPTPSPSQSFLICQDIFVHDVAKSARRALDSINRGAESIRSTIADQQIDLAQLLAPLPLASVTIYLDLQFLSEGFVKKVDAFAAKQHAKIFCCIDPVGQLGRDGNWFPSTGPDNFKTLAEISRMSENCATVSVDATLYQNSGANIVQQTAYALAHASEYLNRIPSFKQPVVFKVSVGSNYFFEIAKLCALRLLFGIIAKEFDYVDDCHIIATPSKRNKTLYDYNVNMLRTTTECMSAIIGGADTIANMPYDALYHKSNEFGERISRNQPLILKHESYFDKVGNSADGSYYIEHLTQQIASKALELFKDIEANGGFVFQLGDGTIQRKIEESAQKEQDAFDAGTEILLGTNKHPNNADRMANDLELFPFVKTKQRKTLIKPIIERRLAEKMEQQRHENEKATGTPNA